MSSSNFSKDETSTSVLPPVSESHTPGSSAAESKPAVVAVTAPAPPVAPAAPAAAPAVVAATPIPSADTLYIWNLSKAVGPEYVHYIEDVMRMVTIQIIIQCMFFFRNPTFSTFFNAAFVELLLYIVLGVSFYWLVIRKLVRIL